VMVTDRPAPLARLSETADAIDGLRVVFEAEEPLDEVLQRVADTAGAEPELVGSVNVYSRTAEAFDLFDERLMALFTLTACQAITNSRRWQHSRDTVTQLESALTSRAEIEQAKGIVMAANGCTADDAFTRLAHRSQHDNVKLRVVARELLQSVRTPDADGVTPT
jgi:hypothetical protein